MNVARDRRLRREHEKIVAVLSGCPTWIARVASNSRAAMRY
ncbi:MAG: hypothetical protein R3E42_15545 [Burkholderiaceae bacterium]